jgi:prolyl oligopeptidase
MKAIKVLSGCRRHFVIRSLLSLLLVAVIGLVSCSKYPAPPETRKAEVTDVIHGVTFVDPYRWLENQESPETRSWIDQQNAYAEKIVGQTALRAHIKERLRQLMDTDDIVFPRRQGKYEFFSMRRTGQDLAVIYRRPAPTKGETAPVDPAGDYEVLIDPHTMSPDHTTRVSIRDISSNGKLLIYSIRDGGQDEEELRILEVETGNELPERFPNALYDEVFFDNSGKGFYYISRSRKIGARVYYHRLGSNISKDREIFGEGHGPDRFINVSEVSKGRYLIFTVNYGWARNDVFFKDMTKAEAVKPIIEGADARFYPQFLKGRLYIRTNLDAPNNRLVAVNLARPARKNWREIIPEGEDVMQEFSLINDKFYVTYLHNVSTKIKVFELDGTPAGEIPIPEFHTAGIRDGGKEKALLTLYSFTTPTTIYRLDLKTGERELVKKVDVAFDAKDIEVKQVWYKSKNNTRVPMFLIHRKDLVKNGKTPTLLYGYGGFNASMTPRFNARAIVWVELGGVYALANIRGGSEFGERWHRAGMLENKQNVFDDFIAAAEWLIKEGYTNPDRLAIHGVSNGGLLVASSLTQRPDLFRAVLCGFPDLDMVRFYTFTENNNLPALHEYGNAAIPEQFEFLRAYSPYQKVKEGTPYPAVMFTSGDLDTRVPPLQARKMTARLQAATSSGYPVVLHYDQKAGHAANRGKPFSRFVDDTAMELAFLLSQLGVKESDIPSRTGKVDEPQH